MLRSRPAIAARSSGCRARDALEAIDVARAAGLEVAGLHVHIGSQLLETAAVRTTIAWLAAFASECRTRLGWVPGSIDLGGGLGVQHVLEEEAPSIETFVGALIERVAEEWKRHELPGADLILEPGRSLVGRAGVTLYRIGVVKRASERVTYVAIDGGMSDNPRPQLYGALYSAIVAERVDDPPPASSRSAASTASPGTSSLTGSGSRLRGAGMSWQCPRPVRTRWRCRRTTTRCRVRPPSSSRRARRD